MTKEFYREHGKSKIYIIAAPTVEDVNKIRS